MNKWMYIVTAVVLITACCCQPATTSGITGNTTADTIIKPVIVTDSVLYDTDDPAIWVNQSDPSASLVLGTDKETDGALYVFNLDGKIVADKVVRNLQRPNNVDVEYGLMVQGKAVDIAVVTERLTKKLRVFSLPDMKPLDNGGLDMFVGDTGYEYRDLMGISLYKDKQGRIYAMVGRKNGPKEANYIWQYLLEDDGRGMVKARVVRKFGRFSGIKEIESIAVDDALGYVYYSDEGYGVRKYYADADKPGTELAVFGLTGFKQDHEGISIYPLTDSTGYILVSDQQTNRFHVFPREGSPGHPHEHIVIKSLHLSTVESDGSEVTAFPLTSTFKKGLFVAMSDDKSFQYYRWEDLMR